MPSNHDTQNGSELAHESREIAPTGFLKKPVAVIGSTRRTGYNNAPVEAPEPIFAAYPALKLASVIAQRCGAKRNEA